MPRPLDGLRVADFTHVLSGPVCTRSLQLLGAEVIKVEPCGAGDIFRRFGPGVSDPTMSPAFAAVNGGKHSIALDLKRPEAQEVARRLIVTSDIVVENFRPGAMDAIGLGYPALSAENPKLIYCSISGYGQDGPLRDAPAFDNVVQSMAGMMMVSGEVGSGATQAGFLPSDSFVGQLAVQAILAALVQRERFELGDHLDVAMLDASLLLMIAVTGPYLISGQRPEKVGNRAFGVGPAVDVFPTAEGEITLGAFTDEHIKKLFALFGCPEHASDERFATEAARRANSEAVKREIAHGLRSRPALEWEEVLNRERVPAAAVREVPEALANPQLRGRDLLRPHSGDGSNSRLQETLGLGFLAKNIYQAPAAPAPRLGEHTDSILKSLGYEEEQITRLRDGGAVA